jgi:hypothetical protein
MPASNDETVQTAWFYPLARLVHFPLGLPAHRVSATSRNTSQRRSQELWGGSGRSDRFPGGIGGRPCWLIKHGNGSLFNS